MSQKIFLTGGAGFIASHLCEALADDHEIVIFDNNKRNALKDSPVKDHKNLTIIEGDIRDRQAIEKAFGDCNTVIHCAAIAGIDSVGLSPIDTMDVNLLGTHNLLEVVKNKKLHRLIQFSTSEVYGPYIYKGTENDRTAQGPVGEVRWTYSVSKLAAEHLAYCYHLKYGLPVVSVRPFNIYGPRQVGEGAIQRFIQNAVCDDDIFINGDGAQIRAWCYVADFVDAILRCLKKDAAVGQVFNIGTPQTGITVNELARLVINLAESKSQVCYRDALRSDVEVRVPSIDKAKKLLGFNPQVDLATGIRHTIQWRRANGAGL